MTGTTGPKAEVRARVIETVGGVKITVEVEELEPGRTNSHLVAEYLRAMFRVRALRRALGEALVNADRRKQKLKASQLVEAQRLLDGVRSTGQQASSFDVQARPNASLHGENS